MADNGQWERELVTKLATAALKEQRRARLWGIFFKLLTFAYITVVLICTLFPYTTLFRSRKSVV